MSISLIDAVFKHTTQKKAGGLVVLLAIADFANKAGAAFPAVATLAAKTRMSERNVQRWLHVLERSGELKILRNQGPHGSNLYIICLPLLGATKGDVAATGDPPVATLVTPLDSAGDASVTQSVNESSIESTPIVPKGDKMEFWINVCFDCFNQKPYRLRPRTIRELSLVIGGLHRRDAPSLLKFYRFESRNSKIQPYNSRRQCPERLIRDLERQVRLALEVFPVGVVEKRDFTLEDVHRYLRETYEDCPLPESMEDLERSSLFLGILDEFEKEWRKRKQSGGAGTAANSERPDQCDIK